MQSFALAPHTENARFRNSRGLGCSYYWVGTKKNEILLKGLD